MGLKYIYINRSMEFMSTIWEPNAGFTFGKDYKNDKEINLIKEVKIWEMWANFLASNDPLGNHWIVGYPETPYLLHKSLCWSQSTYISAT